MSPAPYRSVRSLLLAAVAFSGLPSSTLLASVELEASAVRENTDEVFDRAANLLVEGQLIRARAMLLALQDSPAGAALSDEQSQQLWVMLAKAERQIQRSDRLDISLQKAQLALSTDNLVEAQRQAQMVIDAARSSSEQIEAARAVIELSETRQNDAINKVDSVIDRISAAFGAGDYAHSKLLLTRLGQLGLSLSETQQNTLDSYRDKLASIEQAQGTSFGAYNPAMGMLAPESGMTSDWLTGSTQDGARTGSYLGNQPEDPQAEPIEVELVQEEPQVDLLDAARRFEAQSLLGQANQKKTKINKKKGSRR